MKIKKEEKMYNSLKNEQKFNCKNDSIIFIIHCI